MTTLVAAPDSKFLARAREIVAAKWKEPATVVARIEDIPSDGGRVVVVCENRIPPPRPPLFALARSREVWLAVPPHLLVSVTAPSLATRCRWIAFLLRSLFARKSMKRMPRP